VINHNQLHGKLDTPEYPMIARQAKREHAAIYWGDKMGLRSDHVTGTSYAPVGHTPVIRATGQRFGCSMISAITNKGALAFMVFQGKFKAPVFAEFLKRLLKQMDGRIYLIVDGHPVHRSGAATRFAAIHSSRLRLIRMPGYCPELNPDELLNQDVKTNGLGKSRADQPNRSHGHRAQPFVSASETTADHHEPVSRTTCSLCRVMHYALFGGRLSKLSGV